MVQTTFVGGGFVNFKCRLKCVIIGWLHRRHIETAATAVNVGVIPKLLTPNPPQKYWGEDVAAVGGGGQRSIEQGTSAPPEFIR